MTVSYHRNITVTAAFATLLMLAIAPSCSKSTVQGPGIDGQAHTSELLVDAAIDSGDDKESKAAITNTYFSNGQTIGMFIVRHDRPGEYVPHAYGMDNLRAVSGGSNKWTYNFSDNLGTSVDVLAISSVAKTNADIYAYSPWILGTTSPEKILYESSSQGDLMYAEENGDGRNKNICPDELDEQDVPLRFHHALSIIRIGVRLANSGYVNPTLSSIRISRSSETVETKLWSQARFNSLTGEFIEDSRREMQYIDISAGKTINSTTNYIYFDCLVIPTEVKNDGDLQIELTVNSQPLLEKYEIKLADVLSSDGKKGFQPGYSYTLLFTIDNYLRFRPNYIYVSEEWIDEDLGEQYI